MTNSADTNNMSTPTSSMTSSTRPSSSLLRSRGQVPYAFPTRQPQPDRDVLPASCRPGPRANRMTRSLSVPRQATQRPRSSTGHRDTLRPRSTPSPPPPRSPFELVYSIRTGKFSLERRARLFPRSQGFNAPMLEMQEDMPPLLVDGRMTLVNIPRWQKEMVIFWRSFDGKRTKVWKKTVKLPVWVRMARSFGKLGWTECFVRGV